MVKGEEELKERKRVAEGKMKGMKECIKNIFFSQMDRYIDNYVDKILK